MAEVKTYNQSFWYALGLLISPVVLPVVIPTIWLILNIQTGFGAFMIKNFVTAWCWFFLLPITLYFLGCFVVAWYAKKNWFKVTIYEDTVTLTDYWMDDYVLVANEIQKIVFHKGRRLLLFGMDNVPLAVCSRMPAWNSIKKDFKEYAEKYGITCEVK